VPKDEAHDPYDEAGAHPDVVEFLWDRVGGFLPAAGRGLVYGVPVLLQPDSGIILAVALGTGYAIRVPEEEVLNARANGYLGTWDMRTEVLTSTLLFGPDWLWGRFHHAEAAWIRTLVARFGAPAGSTDRMLTPATPEVAPRASGAIVLTVVEAPAMQPREIATNPTAEVVERTVRSLSWAVMTFVTLERGDQSLTASGSLDPSDGLSASYTDDGTEHLAAEPLRDLNTVVRLLRAYATGDSAWRTMIAWE
jgi:hypothetical protein